MGDKPIIIEQYFSWEVKILWVRIMGVTLVLVSLGFSIAVMHPTVKRPVIEVTSKIHHVKGGSTYI